VFFETLGIKWWYEPEGFSLRFDYSDFAKTQLHERWVPQTFGHLDGKEYWYLPDFYLPELNYWVEIKGLNPTREDAEKAFMLEDMAWITSMETERRRKHGTKFWNNSDKAVELGVFITYGDIPWPFPEKGNILGYGAIWDSGSRFLMRLAWEEERLAGGGSVSVEESERWTIEERKLLTGRLNLCWQECPLCLKIGIGYIGEPFCESCHDQVAEHIEAHLAEYRVISDAETSHGKQKNAKLPDAWLLVEERLQYTGHEFGGDDVSLPVERVSFGLGDGSGYRFRGAVEEVGREACELGLGGRTLGGHQDRLSDAGKSVRGDLVVIEDHGVFDERVGERDGRGPHRVLFASRDVRVGSAGKPHEQFQELLVPAGFVCLVGVREVLVEPRPQVVPDHVRHIPHRDLVDRRTCRCCLQREGAAR
jgi:hypothetical protein